MKPFCSLQFKATTLLIVYLFTFLSHISIASSGQLNNESDFLPPIFSITKNGENITVAWSDVDCSICNAEETEYYIRIKVKDNLIDLNNTTGYSAGLSASDLNDGNFITIPSNVGAYSQFQKTPKVLQSYYVIVTMWTVIKKRNDDGILQFTSSLGKREYLEIQNPYRNLGIVGIASPAILFATGLTVKLCITCIKIRREPRIRAYSQNPNRRPGVELTPIPEEGEEVEVKEEEIKTPERARTVRFNLEENCE